ncbi:nucleotidyl transferase AbiEii/AbiGii toxin family protein [Desulfuromonas thiophila]|uniref:nucleotidyl transferase AbiEii/AbiGii toxin family protein n=1 Tax=Desulfuromonas thiophila TaxID=57664 RepID=UPI0029F47E94|nr:nucleotidyl transferase AbiEii/AbiGii toxin family protein [Desulfuromonas thiophila]
MNIFDSLVAQAMHNRSDMVLLQPVVEKELLHHDILREMSSAGLLSGLTFIGGTCLRMCYGSVRLSEDLDFTGGCDFSAGDLVDLGVVLVERLQIRYGLRVEVSEPVRDTGNVSTWKVRVAVRPERKDLPVQLINIDICSVPSHDSRPVVLRNHYGIELGTAGLILQAQSREEILADKFIALAFRPNRIKYRDLWDIFWLKQNGVDLPLTLLTRKLEDRDKSSAEFLQLLNERSAGLLHDAANKKGFLFEMRRFLPAGALRQVEDPAFWTVLMDMLSFDVERIKGGPL